MKSLFASCAGTNFLLSPPHRDTSLYVEWTHPCMCTAIHAKCRSQGVLQDFYSNIFLEMVLCEMWPISTNSTYSPIPSHQILIVTTDHPINVNGQCVGHNVRVGGPTALALPAIANPILRHTWQISSASRLIQYSGEMLRCRFVVLGSSCFRAESGFAGGGSPAINFAQNTAKT